MRISSGPLASAKDLKGLIDKNDSSVHTYKPNELRRKLKTTEQLKRKIIWTIHLHDFGFKIVIFPGCKQSLWKMVWSSVKNGNEKKFHRKAWIWVTSWVRLRCLRIACAAAWAWRPSSSHRGLNPGAVECGRMGGVKTQEKRGWKMLKGKYDSWETTHFGKACFQGLC